MGNQGTVRPARLLNVPQTTSARNGLGPNPKWEINMSDSNTLPVHPITAMQAIGFGKRGPIWPVLGASEDGAGAGPFNAGAGAATDQQGTATTQLPPEHPLVKAFNSQKAEIKDLRGKADRLDQFENAQKSEAEKAAERIANAEAEVGKIPAKVADGLKAHLIALHKIDSEDAELFLTATDPDLLLKQVDRLIGQSGKRDRSNRVPNEGTGTNKANAGKDSEMREFARNLFGNNN